MADLTMTRLYEVMIVLYAISLVFYFTDYFYKQIRARRVAFWLVSFVWVIQSAIILLTFVETKRFPILSLSEGILFYSWLLVTLSIILHCIARVDLPVFIINILGFLFASIFTFMPKRPTGIVSDTLISELLFIHISFAILSYAAFSLTFVFAILYLVLYRLLKKKKWSHVWTRLPSLQQTSNWMNVSFYIGIPVLSVSLVLGFEWALLTLESLSIFDAKIIGSFIILILYCFILYANRKSKLTGTTYAWVHIYAYLLVVVNFFLGSSLSRFHLWY
ncbi:cytochrome C assembly protein [Lysinibacillus sp. KCTC 33748]|uniref:Cytochrome c biogenesis protein CcsA n=1 Tax=Lysinibacillus zambalensis TaxID=3160866 RepID=A0ABV1MZS9_9BACI|nr:MULTISPECIES: cytochrome c biogenesis protein CcsA [unclassified Lysinibacillus]OXS68730.1 cytochrome C assembly protein [Lysinibacillus sp. KCTC 33748]SKC08274.1 HemX protein [Lysinibacillus sp. AC-3]